MSDDKTAANALLYHSLPRPGKIETVPTKPLVTQEDLSLGYTPGVAAVCKAIQEDPQQADNLTIKANLVAVVTNGSAVLGLGNIGPLASKPVMEGKGILFKKFSNIDVFDIEVDESDPDKFVDIVASLEPTFGGINLEDIKAPECFEIERKLRERMNIPVMHDDQHGTAIIATAAFINSLKLTGKKKENVKIVCVGAGAAGIACMRMLVNYGAKQENITMVDVDGVIYKGREQMNPYIEEFAIETDKRALAEAIDGADYFFGLSAGGVLKPEMLEKMAKNPVVFAMANPEPEIMPDVAKQVRPDAIIGTGRSDFPNQINNVLGFPYLFRGALDVGATDINRHMKLAAAEAIATMARKEADAALDAAYKGQKLKFGPDYLIPKPFDPRLLSAVAPAVADAAMKSGVATRPITDLEQYAHRLRGYLDQSFAIMRQVYHMAKQAPARVVFPEAEEPRILRAAQQLVNEQMCHPILIGREDIVRAGMEELGLEMREGRDFTFIDPNNNPKLPEYAAQFYQIRKRMGLLPPEAEIVMRSRWAALSSIMVRQGDADAMVCGVTGRFDKFLRATWQSIGPKPEVSSIYAMQLVMIKGRVVFLADTHVNDNPTAEQIAEMTCLAAQEVSHFGIEPKVALLSHSSFGSSNTADANKMRRARELIKESWPTLEVEGEMQADAALSPKIMRRVFPESELDGAANILIMPNVDAANIAFNLLRSMNEDGEYIGPILLGMQKPVHILSVDAPVRRIVNMTALAVVEAQARKD